MMIKWFKKSYNNLTLSQKIFILTNLEISDDFKDFWIDFSKITI